MNTEIELKNKISELKKENKELKIQNNFMLGQIEKKQMIILSCDNKFKNYNLILNKMTRKQAELRTYIKKYINKNGYSPSFNEMMTGVGLKSKSGIHRLVEGLVKQGKIKRVKFTRRSVELANYYTPKK